MSYPCTVLLGVLAATLGCSKAHSTEPAPPAQRGERGDDSSLDTGKGGTSLTSDEGRTAFLNILKRPGDAYSNSEIPYGASIRNCVKRDTGMMGGSPEALSAGRLVGEPSDIVVCRITISPTALDHLLADYPVALRDEAVDTKITYVCPGNADFPARRVYYPSASLVDWGNFKDALFQDAIAIYVNSTRSELLACQKRVSIR
jgi:hypothetical protein